MNELSEMIIRQKAGRDQVGEKAAGFQPPEAVNDGQDGGSN